MRHRIAMVIPQLDAGGPDRVVYELLTGIDTSRFELVLVVSKGGGRYFDLLEDKVERRVIGGGRYPVRALAKCIDTLRPDLVFTTLRMNATAAVARAFQRHKVPLVARQANAISADFAILKRTSLVKHRFAEFVLRRLQCIPEAVVAQSEHMAREIRPHLRQGQELAVIGNPVSLSEIEAAAERQREVEEFAPLPGAPSVLATGRLSPQKGFDLLLPAFARFRDCYPEAQLTIRGEGPERDRLEAQRHDLGLDWSVHMPGHGSKILAETASADLFVSSSRYEGFSNAMLEAMALGVPVAATDCPGATQDLVIDGQTGMLSLDIDAIGIADAMLRAAACTERDRLAKEARNHVLTHYDKEAIMRKYEALFARHVRQQRLVLPRG